MSDSYQTQNGRPTLALLLAAGRGKRLRPWTDTTPKPLLPVHGRPTLDFTLQAIQRANIKRVIFVVGHLAQQVVDYVGDGAAWGIEPFFCEQPELLGTAHALKMGVDAHRHLFEQHANFLLTATDYLLEPSVLADLVERQAQTGAEIVASLKRVPLAELAGRSSVRYRDDFVLDEIVEKPAAGEAPSEFSASLTFILPSRILAHLPTMRMSPRGEFEIQALINRMIRDGTHARGLLQPSPAEWRPELYAPPPAESKR